MTGGVVAPAVIAPVAFVLLAIWLAMVFWAADHPMHKEHSVHKGYGVVSNPDTTRARQESAAHDEHEAAHDEHEAAHDEHAVGAQAPLTTSPASHRGRRRPGRRSRRRKEHLPLLLGRPTT
jgi:hypothetical protein